MKNSIELLTGLSRDQRKRVFGWIATLPEEDVISIFQKGVQISHQIRHSRPELLGRDIKYSAFIVSARRAGWDTVKGKGYRVAEQKQFEDFSNLRKSKFAEHVQKGRKPDLRRKVLAHWGEIKESREDGASFASVSRYLNQTRKIKVSTSYLAKLWKEVES